MFNMKKVGINICNLRKSMGITQMELADRLGISFQAVSNWERGVSMPDISKLNELSTLFNVSVDEILDNERTGVIAKSLLENEPIADVSMEEVEEIAPILHEEQVETLFGYADKSKINGDTIASVARFLSQEFIDNFAEELFKESQSIHSIVAIAPFISSEKMDEYAKKAYDENGINAVLPIAPFVSDDILNHMAKETLEKKGLSGIAPIMPFIDSKLVEEYIIKNYKPGDNEA